MPSSRASREASQFRFRDVFRLVSSSSPGRIGSASGNVLLIDTKGIYLPLTIGEVHGILRYKLKHGIFFRRKLNSFIKLQYF